MQLPSNLMISANAGETLHETAIRKLDNERIRAQIHADAAALERIYPYKRYVTFLS